MDQGPGESGAVTTFPSIDYRLDCHAFNDFRSGEVLRRNDRLQFQATLFRGVYDKGLEMVMVSVSVLEIAMRGEIILKLLGVEKVLACLYRFRFRFRRIDVTSVR